MYFRAALAVLATLSTAQQTGGMYPTASISQGLVVGTMTMLPAATAPVNKFLGIPFAQSPPLRFAPPSAPLAFSGPLMAQQVRPACIQQFVYPELVRNVTIGVFNSPPPPAGESEDCLYANVFAPSGPVPEGGRTVMVWIYGGSFQFGSGTMMAYDGSAFAAYHDIVLVTFNYRTNAFGFPAADILPVHERNVGLLDQRSALQWVQANIADFGGDPKKVTIFGESAGSFSVDALLTTYTTATAPFRAAILESGQLSYQALRGRFDAGTSWNALIEALNCGTTDALTCARAVPASQIKSIIEHQSLRFGLTADNVTVPSNAAAQRQVGNFAAVPILIGTNGNEGTVFELGQGQLDQYLNASFATVAPQIIPQIKAAYPSPPLNGYDTISHIQTLAGFQCGSALLANETMAQGVPVWRYYYNATFPNLSPFGGLLGAYHSSEISLVWQTYPGGPINPISPQPLIGDLPTGTGPTAQQYALGQFMTGAWAAFAKNPQLGPGWSKQGTFDGQNLAVIGQQDAYGRGSSGIRLVDPIDVDRPCGLLLPAFRALTGAVSGLGR